MRRVVVGLLLGLAWLAADQARGQATELEGVYEITLVIDDGEVFPAERIRQSFVGDGRLIIVGNTIRFVQPTSGKSRELAFLANPAASPKTVDLAGGEAIGSKGIYQLDGTSLMLCINSPESNLRPKDFSVNKGSHNIFMALKKVAGETQPAKTQPPAKEQPKNAGAEMRKTLVGTWGHQNDDRVVVTTLNEDGTMSSVITWKKGFKKMFVGETRSSGTWDLTNGVLVVRITGSTDSDLNHQVYSFRVVSLSPTQVSYVDQEGRGRFDWKMR